MKKKRIAIFASGEGTNAANIISYFRNSPLAEVALVISNRPEANVLKRAADAGIETRVISRSEFYDQDVVTRLLQDRDISLVVLAGFLWILPASLVKAFHGRIINIHPALLPKFGGKGMYGMNVHKAVLAAREKESGITIHYVNEKYDEGEIISQHRCEISEDDSEEAIAKKIHDLEQHYFPQVIEKLLSAKP